MSAHGAGRRLTAAERERGLRMLADGASERDVARALGCGVATAHRLAQRAATAPQAPAPQAPAATPEPAESEAVTVTEPASEIPVAAAVAVDEDQADDAELTRLRTQLDERADVVLGLRQRETVSRQAMAELDAQRLAGLADGHSDVELRTRFDNAARDAEDWARGAAAAQAKVDELARQIAVVEARKADRALRAQLAEAVAERDRVLATIGDRQRAAVLAVKAAAEEFVGALADQREAVERVGQLAARVALGGARPDVPPEVYTALQTPADVIVPLQFSQALWAAAQGDAKRAAVLLAENWGWLPPDPAELEAERQRVMALRSGQPAPRPPGRPAVPVLLRPGEASVGLDAQGRPLPAPPRTPDLVAPPFGPPSHGHIGGWPV